MKRNNFIIISCILFFSFTFTSCYEDDYEIGEGNSMVYFSNIDPNLKIYHTADEFIYDFGVSRSGFGEKADVKVRFMTEAELADYNTANFTEYSLLPAEYYSLVNNEVQFTADQSDNKKYIQIKFDVVALTDFSLKSKQYAIPLIIDNSNIAIKEGLNISMIKPSIHNPYIEFAKTDGYTTFEYTYDRNFEFETTLHVQTNFENDWDITGELEVSQEVLDSHNKKYKTNYQMLPSDLYSIENTFTIENGIVLTRPKVKLWMKAEELALGRYAIPIAIKNVSKFDVNPQLESYVLRLNIILPKIDNSEWSIIDVSSEASNYKATNLIDGKTDTAWLHYWTVDKDPNAIHHVTVDMSDYYNITHIGLAKAPWGSSAGEVYISDDLDKEWIQVTTYDMANGRQDIEITPIKGRYIKVAISKWKTYAGLSELFVYGRKSRD